MTDDMDRRNPPSPLCPFHLTTTHHITPPPPKHRRVLRLLPGGVPRLGGLRPAGHPDLPHPLLPPHHRRRGRVRLPQGPHHAHGPRPQAPGLQVRRRRRQRRRRARQPLRRRLSNASQPCFCLCLCFRLGWGSAAAVSGPPLPFPFERVGVGLDSYLGESGGNSKQEGQTRRGSCVHLVCLGFFFGTGGDGMVIIQVKHTLETKAPWLSALWDWRKSKWGRERGKNVGREGERPAHTQTRTHTKIGPPSLALFSGVGRENVGGDFIYLIFIIYAINRASWENGERRW